MKAMCTAPLSLFFCLATLLIVKTLGGLRDLLAPPQIHINRAGVVRGADGDGNRTGRFTGLCSNVARRRAGVPAAGLVAGQVHLFAAGKEARVNGRNVLRGSYYSARPQS